MIIADEDNGPGGANMRVSAKIFKAVVQAVLLFGMETWVMTPCIERSLGRFQHKVTRRIIERHPRRQEDGGLGL